MNPWLLASLGIPAVLGGVEGYRRSGGDLGATLGGAVSGATVGGLGYGAERMAGQAIKGLLTGGLASKVAPEAFKVAEAVGGLKTGGLSGAQRAAVQAGLQSPMAQQMGGLNALGKAAPVIAGAGGLAAGALALPVLSGVTNLAGQAIAAPVKVAQNVIGGGAGYKAATGPEGAMAAVPSVSDYIKATGKIPTVANTLGDLNSPFYASLGMAGLQGDVARSIAEKNIRMQYPYISQFKKDDLDRDMYAAQVRQNIATNANLIQSAVGTAQKMGMTAGEQLGQALMTNYNYA
jgi:hypothetical protein